MRSTINGLTFPVQLPLSTSLSSVCSIRSANPTPNTLWTPKSKSQGLTPCSPSRITPPFRHSLIGDAYSTEITRRDDVNPHR